MTRPHRLKKASGPLQAVQPRRQTYWPNSLAHGPLSHAFLRSSPGFVQSDLSASVLAFAMHACSWTRAFFWQITQALSAKRGAGHDRSRNNPTEYLAAMVILLAVPSIST